MKCKEISVNVGKKVSYNWNSLSLNVGMVIDMGNAKNHTFMIKKVSDKLKAMTDEKMSEWLEEENQKQKE